MIQIIILRKNHNMKYIGSKNKLKKYYAPIFTKYLNDNYFVDIFCGGCNLIDGIIHPKRIANDINYYLVEMLIAITNGWKPPQEITREKYYHIKENKQSYSPALVGFVAFLCSFGGKEWGGYAFNNSGRNYALEACKNLERQVPKLQNIIFKNMDYRNLDIPTNSLIYADPPYANTTKYSNKFDHEQFWNWCREKSKTNILFISEYNAPQDFKCIFEKEITSTLNKNKKDPKIEKLFIHESLEKTINII